MMREEPVSSVEEAMRSSGTSHGHDNPAYSGSEIDVSRLRDKVRSSQQSSSKASLGDYDDEDDDEESRCGLGSCKPDCLQVFNNPKAVLVWLCWLSFLQGFMVNGVNNVNTATLERRFQLSSFAAGFISSSYDFAAAALSIPVTYYGAHAHQPRMLSFAAFMMVVGAFVMTIPHFATGLYELRDAQADECLAANATSVDCMSTDSNISKWLGVLILGMMFNGAGGSILYSVGVVYLDSSVSSSQSPLYQAFMQSSATLGPAIGYVLGGFFINNFYVDFDEVDVSLQDISAEDPRFVGAWWIGLMATGCFMFTAVLLLMCYPRELPSAKLARLQRKSEVHNDGSDEIASQEGFGTTFKDFPKCLSILLKNPVYVCINLTTVSEGLLISAFATFMPKFIQNQFSLTAGLAATLSGVVTVLGAAGGMFAGGLIAKLAKLNVRQILRMNIILCLLGAASSTILLCRCESSAFAGLNTPYTDSLSNSSASFFLTSSCNADCGCTTASYEPVCGVDNVQYFTPCHAGCQSAVINGTKGFVNCTCITPPSASASDPADGNEQTWSFDAVSGTCSAPCPQYYLFFPIFFLSIVFVFLVAVPSIAATLRCVPESQRTFAMGIQWVFARFLGTIPGPVLMGRIFDTTCIVWQDLCGTRGSCWVYNNKQLGIRIVLYAVVLKILSTIFFSMAYRFYKPPPPQIDSGSSPPGPSKPGSGEAQLGRAFDDLAFSNGHKPGTVVIPSLHGGPGYQGYVDFRAGGNYEGYTNVITPDQVDADTDNSTVADSHQESKL